MKRFLLYLLSGYAMLMGACVSREHAPATTTVVSGHPIDLLPGSCPYLTVDDQRRVVLSWVRQKQDSTAVFCYAVSRDNGQTFGPPVEIPGSDNVFPHAENIPKIIFKPDGDIIALWGAANPNPKNNYAGLIYYSQSFDHGKTWTPARTLVADPSANDQRYFDVKIVAGGEAAIAWLDARKTTDQKGSALYFAITKGRNGFGDGHLIEQPCCECCRVNLAVDANDNIHVVYRAIIQDSIRDMVYAVSADGGNSFSKPIRISADNWVLASCPHSGPSMTVDNGQVHVSWFTGGKESGIFYARMNTRAANFTAKDCITRRGRHPQMASLENGNILTAWEEPSETGEKRSSRIELEIRNREGRVWYRHFVTPDTLYATYPVVRALTDGAALIAYTVNKGSTGFVHFQKVQRADMTGPWQKMAFESSVHPDQGPELTAIQNSKDPYCGMTMGKNAKDTLLWNGKVVGFCSAECKMQFMARIKR